MISDRELEKLLHAWGARERARLAPEIKAAKERNRAYVMQEVEKLSADRRGIEAGVFSLLWNISCAVRVPLGVFASFVLVVGLFASTVAASSQSLPGSALYPFKLQLEQAQIELQPNAAARVQKKIAFAERRLNEFVILQSDGKENAKLDAAKTVIQQYRGQVVLLTKELAQMQGKEDPRQLAEAAMRLDDASVRGMETMTRVADSASNTEITQTKKAVRAAGVGAIQVLATQYDRAGISVTEVVNRIGKKIGAAKQYVESAASAVPGDRPAQDIFSEAQKQLATATMHLAKNDFGNALNKLETSEGLSDLVDVQTDIQNEVQKQSVNAAKNAAPAQEIQPQTQTMPTTRQEVKNGMVESEIYYSPSKPAYYFGADSIQGAQR